MTRIPWNKGLKTGPQSEELRKKRGEAIRKNLPKTAFKNGASSWNKGLSNTWAIGEKNVNWNGGSTKKNSILRRSSEAKIWRAKVLVRDNFTCQVCFMYPVFIADHIKPFAYFPELRFELSNGRVLCFECHKKTDTFFKIRKNC